MQQERMVNVALEERAFPKRMFCIFSVYGPSAWNKFPLSLRQTPVTAGVNSSFHPKFMKIRYPCLFCVTRLMAKPKTVCDNN